MRKIIFQNMITLDGYFEGPNREIDWHVVDDEYNQYALDLGHSVDTFLFGRITYELMANYWPTDAAITDDPDVAKMMNSLEKVVVSKTLKRVEWENSRLVKGDVVAEVARLKQQPGKDIAMFGSADLAATLIKNDLIDEYRIFIGPVILGEGRPLFKGFKQKLKLIKTRTFRSGLVLLYYQPEMLSQGSDLPEKLSAPARRALGGAGIFRLEQLTGFTEAEIKKLHGVGPNTLDQLRQALAARGLSYANGKKS